MIARPGSHFFALAALALGLWAQACLAQYGPAGNEHPEQEILTDEQPTTPFGDPGAPRSDVEAKRDFARAVDLEPLRGVPVFHNGRIKIMDTLARETVRTLTGRERYEDLVLAPGQPAPTGVAGSAFSPARDGAWRYAAMRPERMDKHRFDPLFTLLDLAIDPAHYGGRPLIAVDYLPLRRLYLEAAFPEDADRRHLWMAMTRVSPAIVQEHSGAIFDRHGDDPQVRAAMGKVDNALRLAAGVGANMVMVAPPSRELPWRHLQTLDPQHPARLAADALGEAWRARDAAAASEAAADLARELAAINPQTQPRTRADLELAYNRGNFFEWGMWAYALAFLGLVLAFGTGRRWLVASGVGLLAVGVVLHAVGFTLRCVIAERFAIQNQFESMTGLSLFAALVATGIMLVRRQWLFGAAAAGVGFLVLIAATQTAIPGQTIAREAAILNTSVLLKYHVTTVLVSYGLISVGFLCSVFYLLVSLLARLRGAKTNDDLGGAGAAAAVALSAADDDRPRTLARTLADLDAAQMTVLQLAFWTLGVGILLGAWWADHSWGRWWAFDPKETWALITWIIYLIVIHVRLITGRNKGLITAWLSVVGFLMMLWTYFGVNLLLPGLHAYA